MTMLNDGEIVLNLRNDAPANPAKGRLRALHYDICTAHNMEKVGTIDLRIGYTTSIVLYGGHIGYRVDEGFRGNHYAAKACKLLFSVAREHGMDVIWITCNPDNRPSRRTCEIVGAEFVEIVDLPPDNDQYQQGERQKCRYRLVLY